MGHLGRFRCNACGKEWTEFVGGLWSISQRRCEVCGTSATVSAEALKSVRGLPEDPHALTDEEFARIAGRCPECGGRFALSAPVRCPSCRSSDLEEGPPELFAD